jgi:putative folate metabolism gamma-glutamate ligase
MVKFRWRFFFLPEIAGEISLAVGRSSPGGFLILTSTMIIKTIKTKILLPPQDDLLTAMKKSLPKLKEKSVVAITSKVVSIWQGRCVPVDEYPDRDKLIAEEADEYLPREFVPGAWCVQSIKNNLLIPSAGIDESNANHHYILWPRDPRGAARRIRQWLKKTYRVKNIGVIITDSHTIPLRRGVLGISLAHCGFSPLKDYRGKPDIFGRQLQMTQTNIADGLAAAAVMLMGEGSECTPLAVIEDVPWIKFADRPIRSRKPFSSLEIKTKEDLYYPLIAAVPWRKGGSGRFLVQ